MLNFNKMNNHAFYAATIRIANEIMYVSGYKFDKAYEEMLWWLKNGWAGSCMGPSLVREYTKEELWSPTAPLDNSFMTYHNHQVHEYRSYVERRKKEGQPSQFILSWEGWLMFN